MSTARTGWRKMIRVQKVHFVGIGGSGMSGIAEILLARGYEVSGSDLRGSLVTERLAALGATVLPGHAAEHVGAADAVVVSTAVAAENPEVAEARRRGIPVVPRAEMLAEIMRPTYGIAVAGTHGKTTTTSMVDAVLTAGGLDPTVVVGGRLRHLGGGARLGAGQYMVVEADESDGSFMKLSPTVAVVTNVDDDHLDHYGSMEALERTFAEFVEKVPFYGFSALCVDDPRLRTIARASHRRAVTYGWSDADVVASDLRTEGTGSTFAVAHAGRPLGRARLTVPGGHNVLNALAAVAVGLGLGVAWERIAAGLAAFAGVDRRLTLAGETAGVRVYDDYGHHPTEIAATLAAVRSLAPRRLVVVFQPHRYTRTRLLAEKFGDALAGAEQIVLMEIYAAGERPIEGVSSGLIEAALRRRGAAVERLDDRAGIVRRVAETAAPGDVVLTLGAGDVTALAPRIVEALEARGRFARRRA